MARAVVTVMWMAASAAAMPTDQRLDSQSAAAAALDQLRLLEGRGEIELPQELSKQLSAFATATSHHHHHHHRSKGSKQSSLTEFAESVWEGAASVLRGNLSGLVLAVPHAHEPTPGVTLAVGEGNSSMAVTLARAEGGGGEGTEKREREREGEGEEELEEEECEPEHGNFFAMKAGWDKDVLASIFIGLIGEPLCRAAGAPPSLADGRH